MSRTLSAGAAPDWTKDSGTEVRRSWTNHDLTDAPYELATRDEVMTQNVKDGETMIIDFETSDCQCVCWSIVAGILYNFVGVPTGDVRRP